MQDPKNNKIKLKVKKLRPDAILPGYAHLGDAGLDLFSIEDRVIKAGERATISTGISIEFPEGYVALVWDKSGLASNSGIKTMAGVIDSTYRGELKIVLLNTSKQDYEIKKGQKICQLLIQPIIRAEIEEISDLSTSARGENGFGSTGEFKK
jgi:dUTP pyrophosphatase